MSHRTTEWIVAGPIAGSFSLAQVNRMLAICLEQLFPGQVRVIPTYRGATEIDDIKPGKIQDTLRVLAQRKVQADQRIVILQSWPFVEPPCDAEQKVGFVFWEETRLPPRDVKHFNNVFGLILSPSEFTTNALQRSGVQIPISTVGLGWDLKKFRQIEPKNNSRTYTFLHISSCIARKGVDLLVRAYVKTFSDNEDVQLVIKGARSTDPSVRTLLDQHCGPSKKPKIIFSEHDIGEDEIVNLYADADCVVLPTRGEGFNLPAAEALAAGRPLVVTGVGGHLDFLDANSARMLKSQFAQSRSSVATPESWWVEPSFDDLCLALREQYEKGRSYIDVNIRAKLVAKLDPLSWSRRVAEQCRITSSLQTARLNSKAAARGRADTAMAQKTSPISSPSAEMNDSDGHEMRLPERAGYGDQSAIVKPCHCEARSLREICYSFDAKQIEFAAPCGFVAMNNSICRGVTAFHSLLRCVNYRLDEMGRPMTEDSKFISRNFLLDFDPQMRILDLREVIMPPALLPKQAMYVGIEDGRLFWLNGSLWCSSSIHGLNNNGTSDMIISKISMEGNLALIKSWKKMSKDESNLNEKNWMPYTEYGQAKFIYRANPTNIVNDDGHTIFVSTRTLKGLEDLRGGSQLIDFDGGRLAVVHECLEITGQRHYVHRFVWFENSGEIGALSRLFRVSDHRVEFVAGLTWDFRRGWLVMSFGVNDREAWIAHISAQDIRQMLLDGV